MVQRPINKNAPRKCTIIHIGLDPDPNESTMSRPYNTEPNHDGTLGEGQRLDQFLNAYHSDAKGKARPDFTVADLKVVAKRLELPNAPTRRAELIAAIDASPQGQDFAAAIGAIIGLSVLVPQGQPLTPNARHVLDVANTGSWRDMLYQFTPADLITAYNELETTVYGDYVVDANIEVKTPLPDRETMRYANVPVRAQSLNPTPAEIFNGLFRYGDLDAYDYYLLSLARRHIANGTQMPFWNIAADVQSYFAIQPGDDWTLRAHHGAILSYMTTTLQPEAQSEMGPNMCMYDVIKQDLKLEAKEAADMVGKQPENGLNQQDMVKIYAAKGRSLYCVDLLYRETLKHVVPNDDREGKRAQVTVLMFDGTHVHRPTPELRAKILNSSGVKHAPEKAEHEVKEPEQEEESDAVIVNWPEALTLAEATVQEHRGESTASIKRQIKEEFAQRLEAHAEETRRGVQGMHKAEFREYKKDARREADNIKAEMAEALEAVPTRGKPKKVRIYVPQATLTEENKQLILGQRKVYSCDIDRTLQTTALSFTSRVKVYANDDYTNLKGLADELGLTYENQRVAALGRGAFKRFKKVGHGWAHSALNNGVSELLDTYPVGPLVYATGTTLDADHEIAAVDFYRNYTSMAHAGGFYTCPLTCDIEKYKGEHIGTEPALYYVETNDRVLFSGNGVYDYKVVEYGLDEGIIALRNVKLQMRMQAAPEVDETLRTFIDYVYATVSNDKNRKAIINALIGAFATLHKFTGVKTVVVAGKAAASYHCLAMAKGDGVVVPIGIVGEQQPEPAHGASEAERAAYTAWKHAYTAYLVTGGDLAVKRKSDQLIRLAIVQRGRRDIYDLMTKIGRQFPVVFVNTDAVYYKKLKAEAAYPVSEVVGFGATRVEVVDEKKAEKIAKRDMPDGPAYNTAEYKLPTWKEPLGELSETEYFDAKRLLAFKRAFVVGKGGSGKSWVLAELCKAYEEAGQVVKKCAFTHAAANKIKGQTCHALFGIDKNGRATESVLKRVMNGVDVLLVDEASMIPKVIWDVLSYLPDTVTIIGFGDFRQHDPVEQGTEGRQTAKYYGTTMFKSLFGYTRVTMRKQCRSNAEAAEQCITFNDVHVAEGVKAAMAKLPAGVKVARPDQAYPALNLCRRNDTRLMGNARCIGQFCVNDSKIGQRVHKALAQRPTHRYKQEIFDAKKLYHVLTHQDEYKDALASSNRGSTAEIVRECTKYLVNAVIDAKGMGRVQVEYYKSSKGRGRWLPTGSMSLATMTRKVRHIVANDEWVDIDAVNCHPAILLQLCEKRGLSMPKLAHYCANRNEVIAIIMRTLGVDRDLAKKIPLSLINGGTKDYYENGGPKVQWLVEFKAEMEKIWRAFIQEDLEGYMANCARRRAKGKEYTSSDQGAFVNGFLVDKEVEMLDAMIEYLESIGAIFRPVGGGLDQLVMCSDGLMFSLGAYNAHAKANGEQALLDKLAEVVLAKTGLVMKFERKIMTPMATPDRDSLPMPVKHEEWQPFMDPAHWDEFYRLDVGMPVIANANNRARGYTNNATFKVLSLAYGGDEGEVKERGQVSGDLILLEDADEDVPYGQVRDMLAVSQAHFRADFRPGYFITTYKAQSATYRQELGIHDIEKMGPAGAYVALTRAVDPANITLFPAMSAKKEKQQGKELRTSDAQRVAETAPKGVKPSPEPKETKEAKPKVKPSIPLELRGSAAQQISGLISDKAMTRLMKRMAHNES